MTNQSDNLAEVGSRLTERAKLLRLKQKGIAKHVGVSCGTVSTWFKGKGIPKRKSLELLAEALQTTSAWILTGDTTTEGHIYIQKLDAKAVGVRLQNAIWNKKMRHVDFADAIGMSASIISQWVSGRLLPDSDKIELAAEVLDVTSEWLSTGKVERKEGIVAKANAEFIAHSNTVIEVEEITELDTSSINNKADISVELQLHKLIGELQKKAYDEGYAQAQADIKQLWDKK